MELTPDFDANQIAFGDEDDDVVVPCPFQNCPKNTDPSLRGRIALRRHIKKIHEQYLTSHGKDVYDIVPRKTRSDAKFETQEERDQNRRERDSKRHKANRES